MCKNDNIAATVICEMTTTKTMMMIKIKINTQSDFKIRQFLKLFVLQEKCSG